MTVTTVRPNADISRNFARTEPPSDLTSPMWPVLSDNNDSTDVAVLMTTTGAPTNFFVVALDTFTVPAPIARVRVRVRWKTYLNAGVSSFAYALMDGAGNLSTPDAVSMRNEPAAITDTGGWRATAPDGGPWTQAKLDDLRVRFVTQPPGGAGGVGASTNPPMIIDVYVDVETNVLPVVAIGSPTGTVSDTLRPVVLGTYTDADSDPMDAYEVKVYTAAQYGAAGFSPDTSTPTWTSGVVSASGSTISAAIGQSLTNGTTHRAYLRARQGGDVVSQWSAWTSSTFSLSVPVPAPVTGTVGPESSTMAAVIGITGHDNRIADVDPADFESGAWTEEEGPNLLSANDASLETGAGGWAAITNCTVARMQPSADGVTGVPDGTWALKVTTTTAGTSQAQSALTPVSAGVQYVAAAYVRQGNVAPHACRIDLKFYNASSALIATVGGTNFTPTALTFTRGTVAATAPAGSAFATVVVTFLGDATSEYHYVDAASLSPSFLVNASAAISTAQAASGTRSLALTAVGGTMSYHSPKASVSPSAQFTALASVRAGVTSRFCSVDLLWFNGSGALIGQTSFPASSVADSTSAWSQLKMTATSPAGAASASVLVTIGTPGSPTAGEVHYIDKVGVFAGDVSTWSRGGVLGGTHPEIERSTDGGLTWTPVDRVGAPSIMAPVSVTLPVDTQTIVVRDYELPRGVAVTYRARVTATVAGAVVASPWVTLTGTINLARSGWWFKNPDDPTKSVRVNVHSPEFKTSSPQRSTVHQPLGARTPVVLSDVVGAESGSFDLSMLSQSQWQDFEKLRADNPTVLVQSPYGDHFFAAFVGDREQRFTLNPAGQVKRTAQVNFVEVGAP